MRIGIRLGPFWASTRVGGRKRRTRKPAFHGQIVWHGRVLYCQHNHRTEQAAAECARKAML